MPKCVQREVTLRGLLLKCKKKNVKKNKTTTTNPTMACRTILPILVDFKRHVYSFNVEVFCYFKKQTSVFLEEIYTVMHLPGKS